MFDRTRVIEINQSHSSFKVEVGDQVWSIEMNGTSNLVHEGWKKTTVKPGDKVTVSVNPLRDGRPGGWFVGIMLPDGSTLGTPAAAAPTPGTASEK